jgi:hypothetical protein
MSTPNIYTRTSYNVIDSFLGETPNSYSVESFSTIKEAIDYHDKEYKNRSKGDGHDEYHRNKECGKHCYILETIKTVIKID